MKKILSLLLLFGIVGCASNPESFFRSPGAIIEDYEALKGKGLDIAINKMGIPNEEQDIAGMKVFTWTGGEKSTAILTGQTFTATTWQCEVKVVLSNGVITNVEVKANSVYYCPGNKTKTQ